MEKNESNDSQSIIVIVDKSEILKTRLFHSVSNKTLNNRLYLLTVLNMKNFPSIFRRRLSSARVHHQLLLEKLKMEKQNFTIESRLMLRCYASGGKLFALTTLNYHTEWLWSLWEFNFFLYNVCWFYEWFTLYSIKVIVMYNIIHHRSEWLSYWLKIIKI